jgi:hypothetical protein
MSKMPIIFLTIYLAKIVIQWGIILGVYFFRKRLVTLVDPIAAVGN